MSIFMLASRQKLRFPSTRGPLTVEQLWDMPLQSKAAQDFSLDAVAKQVNRELKATVEESFVAPVNAANVQQQLMLDVLKYIISAKLEEAKARENATAVAQERHKLLAILEDKQDDALKAMTAEQIKARLAALS